MFLVAKNEEKKIKFIIMYGQTEASPRMSYLKWIKFSEKSESIGRPVLNKSAQVVGVVSAGVNKLKVLEDTKGHIVEGIKLYFLCF